MYVNPRLYTKEILSILRDAVLDKNINNSDQLDDSSKDQLSAHAIRAFEHDIDICLSPKSLEHLSNSIINKDFDYSIDFYHQVKEDCFNQFSTDFDIMINQIIDEIELDKQWRMSA